MFEIVFQSSVTKTIALPFFRILSSLKNDWPAKIIAYVLMPEHFHFISNPEDGDIQGFTGTLKSKVAREIFAMEPSLLILRLKGLGSDHNEFWQESFKAIPLWSSRMIWQKINYIHANPVRAGLVSKGKQYPWSSFNAFYSKEQNPLEIDRDWWWPDDVEKLSKAMKELGWRTYHKRNYDKG